MATSEISTARMTSSLSWMRLLSHCMVALLLFLAVNVYTYEMSGFFRREQRYTGDP